MKRTKYTKKRYRKRHKKTKSKRYTKKRNKRGGSSSEIGSTDVTQGPAGAAAQPQPDPMVTHDTELLDNTEEIKEYVKSKLEAQFVHLSESKMNSILFAAKTYSHQYDGFLHDLIINYLKSDGKLDIFEEIIQKWVLVIAILSRSRGEEEQAGDGGALHDHLTRYNSSVDDHVFGKYRDACRAINSNLLFSTNKEQFTQRLLEVISLMYATMKQNYIILDKELIVYRVIVLNEGDELITDLYDFTSTTYDTTAVFDYLARNLALDNIIKKLIEEGYETLDFTGHLISTRILKIKLPIGLKVFHTDICGGGDYGEKELVILDQCKLNILSETELDGTSELLKGLDDWVDDFVGNFEELYEEYDFEKMKIDKTKFKIKYLDCTISINREQIDFDEVIIKPLLSKYVGGRESSLRLINLTPGQEPGPELDMGGDDPGITDADEYTAARDLLTKSYTFATSGQDVFGKGRLNSRKTEAEVMAGLVEKARQRRLGDEDVDPPKGGGRRTRRYKKRKTKRKKSKRRKSRKPKTRRRR
jgi:hypothetical protein